MYYENDSMHFESLVSQNCLTFPTDGYRTLPMIFSVNFQLAIKSRKMHNVHTLAWYEVIKVKQTLMSSAQL